MSRCRADESANKEKGRWTKERKPKIYIEERNLSEPGTIGMEKRWNWKKEN